MADRNMKFTLDFLAKTAGLKDSAELLDKIGDEFDDTVDGGKKLAAAMRLIADRVENDLDETRKVAESLGNALGPELSRKLGQSGLDSWAVKMRQAGLSMEEIDANIDDMADSVRRLDAATSSVDQLDTSMQKVSASTDNTRSVFANFAGNTAQELPGVAGAFGPLNMAISQFTEYAAEGNIRLASLVQFAGPMAVVGAAAWGLSKNLQKASEIKAWETDRLERYVELLGEGKTAAEALEGVLGVTEQKIEFRNVSKDVADLVPLLSKFGITWDEMAARMRGSRQEFSDWVTAQGAVGADYLNLLTFYDQNYQLVENAADDAAAKVAVFGETTEEAAQRQAAAKRSGDALNDTLDRQKQAYADLYESIVTYADAHFGLFDAQDRANDALNDYNATLTDSESTLEDVDDAARNTAGAFIDLAKEQAEAEGQSADTAAGQQIMRDELQKLVDTLAPGSPLRLYLEGYISDLNRIPSNKNTQVTINGKPVNVTTGNNGVPLVVAPGGGKDGAIIMHDGGVVPGPRGTEVPAILAAGETVLPTHKAAYSGAMSDGGGGTGSTVYNIGPIYTQATNGEELARELKEYMRRNGGRL